MKSMLFKSNKVAKENKNIVDDIIDYDTIQLIIIQKENI